MPNLSIKGVPEEVVAALRARAARNHRSLQGELLELVTRTALQSAPPDEPSRPAPRSPSTAASAAGRAGPRKTIEQIAREHGRRFPIPIAAPVRAVDIVRKARDAR